jgi:hypothetical protein
VVGARAACVKLRAALNDRHYVDGRSPAPSGRIGNPQVGRGAHDAAESRVVVANAIARMLAGRRTQAIVRI